jgi:hypothetical protein
MRMLSLPFAGGSSFAVTEEKLLGRGLQLINTLHGIRGNL